MFVINQAARASKRGSFSRPQLMTKILTEGFPSYGGLDLSHSYINGKEVIRQVFLNWVDSDLHASVTGRDQIRTGWIGK